MLWHSKGCKAKFWYEYDMWSLLLGYKLLFFNVYTDHLLYNKYKITVIIVIMVWSNDNPKAFIWIILLGHLKSSSKDKAFIPWYLAHPTKLIRSNACHWYMEGIHNKYVVDQPQTLSYHYFNFFTLLILPEIIVFSFWLSFLPAKL